MSAGAFRCGHDRAPHNVYTDSNGTMRCRSCRDRRRAEYTPSGATWQSENRSPAIIAEEMEAASKRFLALLWSEHPGIMRHAKAAGRQVVRP